MQLGKMGRHAMNLTPVFLVVAIVAVLPSVPVHAQSDAPKVERPVWPPPGSTWTVNLKLSGSLGSGVREATFESLGEVDWHGRRVMGNYMRGAPMPISTPSGALLLQPAIVSQFRLTIHTRPCMTGPFSQGSHGQASSSSR